MNQKRTRFVEAFVGEAQGNATKAAILAGYSENGAGQTAHNLLKETEIKAAIEAREKDRAAKVAMTDERILQELATVATSEVKVSSADKMKALELLGKHRKLWHDKQQDGNGRIVVNIGYLATNHQPPTINITAPQNVATIDAQIDSPSTSVPISLDSALVKAG